VKTYTLPDGESGWLMLNIPKSQDRREVASQAKELQAAAEDRDSNTLFAINTKPPVYKTTVRHKPYEAQVHSTSITLEWKLLLLSHKIRKHVGVHPPL